MEKTKFTEGPWEANVWTCGRRSIYQAVLPGRTGTPEIAEVWPTHNDDEHRANTRLIAAAPELYKACEIAINHCKGQVMLSVANPEEDWQTERDMLAAFLEDVLAKARGELT